MNPYKGLDFIEFLLLFFQRLPTHWRIQSLAHDEVQIYMLLLTGSAAICVSLFLLLQKKMMVANAISHTVLLGIVLFLMSWRFLSKKEVVFDGFFSFSHLIIPALIAALVTQLLIHLLTYKMHVQKDASIGIVFTFLFALGVLFVSISSRNSHLGLEAIMGNIDAVSKTDLKTAFQVSLITGFWIGIFLPIYRLISFDRGYAKSLGIGIDFFDLLLMVFCGLALVLGFKSVGSVMVLSFMTFPIMTASLFFHSIVPILILALILNGAVSVGSVALSRAVLSLYGLPLSTAGIFVTLFACLYLACFILRQNRRTCLIK